MPRKTTAKYPHVCGLHLTKTQLAKLARGETIQVKPQHMTGGPHSVHLGVRQHAKMSKALAEGKGARIRFSQHQIRHHAGTGLFDVLRRIGALVKPFIRPAATFLAPYAKSALMSGADKLISKIGDKLIPLNPRLGHAAERGLNYVTGEALEHGPFAPPMVEEEQIEGHGVRRRKAAPRRKPARKLRGGSFALPGGL